MTAFFLGEGGVAGGGTDLRPMPGEDRPLMLGVDGRPLVGVVVRNIDNDLSDDDDDGGGVLLTILSFRC